MDCGAVAAHFGCEEFAVTLWTTADIARALGVARKTVTDKWTKRPDFPPPKQRISRKVVRWSADEVQAWATGERR